MNEEQFEKFMLLVQGLSDEVKVIGVKVDDGLHAVRTEMQENAASLRAEMQELRTEMQDGLDRLDAKIDAIGEKLAGAIESISIGRDSVYESLDKRIEKIEKALLSYGTTQ